MDNRILVGLFFDIRQKIYVQTHNIFTKLLNENNLKPHFNSLQPEQLPVSRKIGTKPPKF